MTQQLNRGEVWLANLDPTQGSEQAGIRPVIIFQNDMVSKFSTTTITIPLTTNSTSGQSQAIAPGHRGQSVAQPGLPLPPRAPVKVGTSSAISKG
ncbi:type II toxin-antitoxin system PemK/MazF family toxin [Leptothoe sp. ISB3NOV94-8A]|nr:type II toxin-antitoxin system PemK/MazF family toxin [Leptothoe sp. LEGE 181152]